MDGIIGKAIHAIAGPGRGRELQVPRTPALHVGVALALVEREGEGGVGAEVGVGEGAGFGEQGGGADADRVGEVGRDEGQARVVGLRVEGDDGQGQVVAVDEGDVVEGLAAAGGEGEFGEGDGGHALDF